MDDSESGSPEDQPERPEDEAQRPETDAPERPQDGVPDRPDATSDDDPDQPGFPLIPGEPGDETAWLKPELPGEPSSAPTLEMLGTTGLSGDQPPRRGRTALAAVLAALVLLSGGIGIGWSLTRANTGTAPIVTEPPVTTVPPAGSSSGNSGRELSREAIARRVDPAIVDINTVLYASARDRARGGRARGAAGTGMILTPSGEVLTNNHVVAGATSISVVIQGRSRSFTARVIGVDPSDDVALLQINGVSGLPTVTLADSSALTVGQPVLAIGNALGRGGTPTITEGSISALGRSITIGNASGGAEHLSNLIQTDAPVSPGDSGGALVNRTGQVVGVLTAAATIRPVQSVSRVSYAIPVNGAVGIVNQIRTGRETSDIILGPTGFLGVEVRNLDPVAGAQLGLGVSSGALVLGVIPDTPAARAGIPSEAVITEVDGREIASADELGPVIYHHKPGERIRVTWVDRDGRHTAMVTLIAGPAV
jgi:S1-C subfamily serine protease